VVVLRVADCPPQMSRPSLSSVTKSHFLDGLISLDAASPAMVATQPSFADFRRALFLLICICGPIPHSQAAEPANPLIKDLQSEYVVDSWQTEQGLPDNFINKLAQTPDGYLWIATFNGLARFNGAEFVTFDASNTPELADSRITFLKVDGAGGLWIGSETGQLSLWSAGHFRSFNELDGFAAKDLDPVQIDPAGNLVVAHSNEDKNYRRFIQSHFEPVQCDRSFFRLFGNSRDKERYGWGIEKAKLFSTNPNQPQESVVPNLSEGKGWRLTASKSGGMWVIAGRFQKFNNGVWEDYGPLPKETDAFGGYVEDREGNLWVGTDFGELWRVGTNRITTRFKLTDSTVTEFARYIITDAEGNLWIGTGGNGLLRLKPRVLKTYNSRDGLASDVIRSVTEDRAGNIWLATVNRIDCFDHERPFPAQAHHREIELPWIVYGGRNGELWVGCWGEGLYQFSEKGARQFLAIGKDPAPPNLAVFETRAGDIYLGTARGLFVVEGNSLLRCGPPALPLADVRAITEDAHGDLYVGLKGEGLLEKSSIGWTHFTQRNGLPDDQVFALHGDADGAIWVGTIGKGLSRFKDGKFFNFFASNPALPRFINSIVEDDEKHLWFGSNRGIFRASLQKLNEEAEGRGGPAAVTSYSRADGMGSSQCTGGACKAHDGKIWFATMNGVTVVDPHSLPSNKLPPPVVIEQVLIDDKLVSKQSPTVVKVPPGMHRLEIRFAGLSFTAPDRVRFQYRLEGTDQDWVEGGNRRFASYTGIPPGEHRFQVLAANNDGVWNNEGASFAVLSQPYLWQRPSFQVSALLALLVTAVALARYWSSLKLRHRLEELERRHALDNERGRISRDLHDSLGADLSQLALWSELAIQEKDRPAVMAERARDFSSLTREVIQNVEEIVWTVNPRNDSLDRFTAYLCEFAERVAVRAGLRFRWEAPEDIPPLPLASDIRHHLFLVTKEALNNLVKHADASEARLQLSVEDRALTIIISDNGRGFDLLDGGPGAGNGLTNMTERLGACGGTLAIESSNGVGTTIRLRVPLPARFDR
jgi:signal transduction histidine kinase/ligand-binding sensor domain-containing protein